MPARLLESREKSNTINDGDGRARVTRKRGNKLECVCDKSRRFLPSFSSLPNHHPPQLIPTLLQHQPRPTFSSYASLSFQAS